MPSSLTTGEVPIRVNTSHTLWHESALTRSITKDSKTFSLRSVRKFSSSYHSAGLLDDCKHALFYSDSQISVYQLGDLRTKATLPSFSKTLNRRYKHGEVIRNVASSKKLIVVVTNKRLLIFNIDADTLVDTISHGDWDPSGIACHESETHMVVLLGQCQRNTTNKYKGQIRIYRYGLDGHPKKLPIFALNLPLHDCPKRLFFDMESQILTCITRIQNRVLAWKLDDDFLTPSEPFEFLKNNYAAVSSQNRTVLAI